MGLEAPKLRAFPAKGYSYPVAASCYAYIISYFVGFCNRWGIFRGSLNDVFIQLFYEPIITEFFENEEEMAKFQKWREEYEEKERLEKEEKAKKKAGAA